MFIGICSRSQVSVYRTIGPLVFNCLVIINDKEDCLQSCDIFIVKLLFLEMFSSPMLKAHKVSLYLYGSEPSSMHLCIHTFR